MQRAAETEIMVKDNERRDRRAGKAACNKSNNRLSRLLIMKPEILISQCKARENARAGHAKKVFSNKK